MLEKVSERHCHCVSQTAIVRGILDLFCVEIAAVDSAGNVSDGNGSAGLGLADLVVAQVKVFHAFCGDSRCPVNACLVVVVDDRRGREVVSTKVVGNETECQDLLDALASSNYFCFARAEGGLVLTNGAPRDGATTVANEVPRDGPELEHFNGRAIWDGVPHLAPPARVAEGSELLALRRGRRCGVGVSLLVVVAWEVIVRLECGSARRVAEETKGARTVEVLEAMKG